MRTPARDSSGGPWGVLSRIAFPLTTLPASTERQGAAHPMLLIREGATAGPYEAFRDATRPVELCARDNTFNSATNSMWTVSGRVMR